MLKHFSNFAGVDYNRAGVPLIEIVSEPCLRTPEDAKAYASAIKAILQYLNVSDCNMEEGSLRVDANISVRKKGETNLRNKIEIKNMNSFSNMVIALHAEIKRQIQEYQNHPHKEIQEVITTATYRFDPEIGQTVLMRKKEQADDYRYFPEPDLAPILITDEQIEKIRKELPELPLQRERRYVKDFSISPHHAFIITAEKPLADYFEGALKHCSDAKLLCNWMIVEFAGRFKDSGQSLLTSGISPLFLGKLIKMIENETINGKIAKAVATVMLENPEKDPEQIVKENPDFCPVNDTTEIESLVNEVIQKNPQSIIDFKAGKDKAFGFLVGEVMKLSSGKASPKIVNELLKQKINS